MAALMDAIFVIMLVLGLIGETLDTRDWPRAQATRSC
jgi:hypothetical protein